jgi:hypothetical protein
VKFLAAYAPGLFVAEHSEAASFLHLKLSFEVALADDLDDEFRTATPIQTGMVGIQNLVILQTATVSERTIGIGSKGRQQYVFDVHSEATIGAMTLPRPIFALLLAAVVILPFRRARHVSFNQTALPSILAFVRPAVRKRNGDLLTSPDARHITAARPADVHQRHQVREPTASKARHLAPAACLPDGVELPLVLNEAGSSGLAPVSFPLSQADIDTPYPPPRLSHAS